MSKSSNRKSIKSKKSFHQNPDIFYSDDPKLQKKIGKILLQKQSEPWSSEVDDYEESKEEVSKESIEDDSLSDSPSNRRVAKEHKKESELKQLISEVKDLRKELSSWIAKIVSPLERIAKRLEGLHTSQNISSHEPINGQNYDLNYENQQSEVIIHKVEDYESIRELYPFEKFKRDEVPSLGPISRKEYERLLKLAENQEPLAYFLYQNRTLTLPTMKSFILTFKEYFSKHDKFDLTNLKLHYIEKDLSEIENKETLKKKWKQWRRLSLIVYGVKKDDFRVIKFSSKKKGKEQDHSAYDKDVILKAWNTLSKQGNKSDALLLHLMLALALRPGEAKLIKFEDVELKNSQVSIKVYKSKKDRTQQLSISQQLYDEIISYKQHLISNDKYQETTRKTIKGDAVVGHFLFWNSRNALGNKFKGWFNGATPEFKLRPKDTRIAAIRDRNAHGSLTEAAALADHRSTKITTSHYIRSAIELNPVMSKQTRSKRLK